MAAERTGRRAYAMDFEPRYVDVAVRRWQAFTGKDAVDAESGCTFDALAERAGPAHEPTDRLADRTNPSKINQPAADRECIKTRGAKRRS
jgi:hypothetical protein